MTTKTGKRIAEAFRDGRILKLGNTVTHSLGASHVWLHGRVIAWVDREGVVQLSLSGWPGATTRDRLNAILEALGSPSRFFQHRYTQYYGIPATGAARPVDSVEWVPLAGPLGMRALLAARMAAE